MRKTILCLAVGISSSLGAQGASNPEIYLMPLTVRGANVSVGKPVNITNRPGYDNQPSFTADGRELFFTSVHADSQADIYRYNIEAKVTERLTKTAPESEYSATQLPYPKNFSVIQVERDSTQRLHIFSPDGTPSRPAFADIKPVGYHTWVNDSLLALFVLGNPNALVLADYQAPRRSAARRDTIARDIGRSLVTIPGRSAFTFFSRRGQDWMLTEVRLDRRGQVLYIHPLIAVPRGMDYIAWIGGKVIGGTGSKLMSWTPGTGAWTEIADLSSEGITRISRIAVSRDLRRLAIVAEPAAGTAR